MKKNYFYLFLALPVIVMLFTSSTGGRDEGRTGSPGDAGNTCTECHASGANFGASVAITSTVPANGYALNTTYSVTVTLTSSPNSTKSGFQFTAEKQGGTKVGTFSAGSGSGSRVVNTNNRVTQSSAGSAQKSWTFNWTSPTTDQGAITFYASGNATNNNGNTAGDQVVTATRLIGNVLSNQEFGLATFKMYPNPSTEVLNISLPEGFNQANAMVVDVMGKTIINQTITENISSINIQSLPAGTYILNLVSDDATATKTFVKK